MASGGDSLVPRLAAFISDFIAQLSSHRVGSLAQIWLPETGPDGSVELYTQGLPYSINGVGDLLALFRCISCKYKFATDPGKALQMGAVGRVFTSGEPEMSHNVQRYDQHVYLRAAEAQRCRVHSTLFMPLYASARRDSCVGVFEVVLTDPEPNFAGMVGWIISCLSSEGLFTAEVDTASLANQGLGMSLLGGAADRDGVSALESGAQLRGAAANGRVATERGSGVPAGAAGGAATAHSGGGGPAGRDELAELKQGAALPQAGRSQIGRAHV